MNFGMGPLLILCGFSLFSVCSLIVSLINRHVPTVYMDEIFHVDQMQKYCAGNFTAWNLKITTPPGLYIATLAVIKPLMSQYSPAESKVFCSVQVLRFVNPLFLTVSLFVMYGIIRNEARVQRKFVEKENLAVAGVALVLFPVYFFSALLYYTDVLSVLCVLLMYYLTQRGLSVFSALMGVCACCMRQTNIVWALFCAGLTIEKVTEEYIAVFFTPKNSDPDSSSRRDDETPRNRSLLAVFGDLLEMAKRKPGLFGQMLAAVFAKIAPFLMLTGGFLIFVIFNRGIALGDKSAHEAVFHVPQIYYWAGFCLVFASPYLLTPAKIRSNIRSMMKNKKLMFGCLGLMLIGINFFTYEHPYLLADNRHYTFYIWKNWFRRHWTLKYLLAPGYLFSVHSLANSLKHKSGIFRLGYAICTALVTVPNKLLEFRYFIIPFLLFRASIPSSEFQKSALLMETVIYLLLNVVTVYLFLYQPFQWSHEPGIQRFMW